MIELEGYKIQGEIYGSRRGILYAGVREADRRPVILKKFIIPPEKQAFADKYVSRYLRECKWLESLNHPNTISVIEILPPTASRPVPVLVMERLERSLQQEYQDGRAGHEQIVAWMVQILLGLKALHDKEIIHRDIKASNVMLDTSGNAKIIDLSIAVKLGDEITLAPEDISTITAAPEMYKGRAGANFSSDVYAVGFTIYQLLCGKGLFEEQFADVVTNNEQENLYRWMYWHCNKNVALRLLSEVNPSIPEYLSNIVAKMTAKNVDERYQTVDEILSDLAAAVATKDKKEAFVLVIKDSIPSDYWRGSRSYEPDDEPAAAAVVAQKPEKKSKRGLLVALALIWVLALGGGGAYFTMTRPKPVAAPVPDEAGDFVKNAREAYRVSNYAEAKTIAADGLNYIAGVNASGALNDHAAFLTQLDRDVDWITGLESTLSQAVDAVRLPNAEDAKARLSALLAERYEKGERYKTLHEISSVKFDDLQNEAQGWLDALDRVIPIYAARAEGKYRRAHFRLLSTELPEKVNAAVTADVVPVIDALDAGRAQLAARESGPARDAFEQAAALGAGTVPEAAYHLSFLAVGALSTLDPMQQVDSYWTAFAKPGMDQSIAQAVGRLADLRVRVYDLDHRLLDPGTSSAENDLVSIEPGMRGRLDAAFAELNQSIESIMGQLREEMQNAEAAGAEIFRPELPEACKYPLEESEGHYLDRFSDVLRLRIGTALDAGSAGNTQALDDAATLAGRLPESTPEADKRYFTARLHEQSLLGGTPAQAIDTYEQLVTEFPGWADCHYRIAVVSYFLQKDPQRSAEAFAEAIRLAPENERYRWWAAKVAVERATLAVGEKDWSAVTAATDAALTAWPDFPTAYFARAMAAIGQNDAAGRAANLDAFRKAFDARRYRYAMDEQYMKMAETLASN